MFIEIGISSLMIRKLQLRIDNNIQAFLVNGYMWFINMTSKERLLKLVTIQNCVKC